MKTIWICFITYKNTWHWNKFFASRIFAWWIYVFKFNLTPFACNFSYIYLCVSGSVFGIRIRIRKGPEYWIRIQFGSESTTLPITVPVLFLRPQVAASCPIDRIQFSQIHVRAGGGEEEGRVEKVVVKRQQPEEEQQEEEPEIQCEVCTRGDRENLLLLCDGCDLGTTITYW